MNINESLLEAVRNEDMDTAKALLAKGANVNARDDYGKTALSLALQNGHKAVADMLRNAGAK